MRDDATTHRPDGSAGDADYSRIGAGYTDYRQPDPRIERAVARALGDARTVLNVGAGAGSYEPRDRAVTAVEPSAAMRAQRPSDLTEAVDATSEALPFDDDSFDASMSTFSIHQWGDLERGLAEMRRVTRGPVVLLSCDPTALDGFWLVDYAPEVIGTEASRYPALDRVAQGLGGDVRTASVPIPLDCTDGFSEAYYGRPERLLEPGARLANSAWSFVPDEVVERFVRELGADLANGAWDERQGILRTQPEFDGSLRLIVGHPMA
jgi:SAM-dependent methyltransferase